MCALVFFEGRVSLGIRAVDEVGRAAVLSRPLISIAGVQFVYVEFGFEGFN